MFELGDLQNIATLKSSLGVTRGHWKSWNGTVR